MSACLAALLLATGPPVEPEVSAPPHLELAAPALSTPIGDLQLQLDVLRSRRDAIHWTVPAVVTAVGLYAGWTAIEATVVTVVGAAVGCQPCASDEPVTIGIAIGGALVTLVGLVWLAVDFHHRTQLTEQIADLERRIFDLRLAPPGAPPAAPQEALGGVPITGLRF